MIFLVVGYMIIIENDKHTCTDDSQLLEKINEDRTGCAHMCDGHEKCNYLHINDDNRCALYSSCTKRKMSKVKGSTYEKNGSDIKM